ncbi:MAG: galactonate dehydratase [Rhodospirillaceae bacterium]|nr:galactonate dehydratase [Rhodospirillaceae bacterium]|tara:strand:+ start:302 stop:1849 length:1548 start_codon:yes stop_codon:yes gene_type:complete
MLDLDSKKTTGPAIQLNNADNVAIALSEIEAGTGLSGSNVVTREIIPPGYKVAICDIPEGSPIKKYDVTVGFAKMDILAGTMLHNHNIEFKEFDRDYAYSKHFKPIQLLAEKDRTTFQGYKRPDGRAGTRNFISIVSTVNCSATVVHAIADYFTETRMETYPNVDGVAAFSHNTGCGMEMTGEPMDLLHRTLAGYIKHPNVAASLVVGLGCERCQVGGLFESQKLDPGISLRTLVMQESGGTRKTISQGISIVEELLEQANQFQRETVSARHIMVGLQCGGSDGFSSITANPSLGKAIDILSLHGGTGILSETPEIYGVEHTLTARAASVKIGKKLIERIRWWKDEYAVDRDVQINGTVSPGNQRGGLANILEKSLGASMKGGTGPLMEVYKYAEPVTANGFVFMDTPGFDPVSATGQIAGGANLIAFTTGRGSCFGAKPSPSIKLATNTPMFERLEEDMDINCGAILDGEVDVDGMGQRIFDYFLLIASGKKTKSEELALGRHEFVPWNIGITG